ncbi:hypothetical protein GYMLUDRAFT_414652 [Collybiopsis luxurians FD-317 M1]|nr:hypothetical protein GYMLUDRAFT_414652 [Collybiopsis luxurians FD-317 M1]
MDCEFGPHHQKSSAYRYERKKMLHSLPYPVSFQRGTESTPASTSIPLPLPPLPPLPYNLPNRIRCQRNCATRKRRRTNRMMMVRRYSCSVRHPVRL